MERVIFKYRTKIHLSRSVFREGRRRQRVDGSRVSLVTRLHGIKLHGTRLGEVNDKNRIV